MTWPIKIARRSVTVDLHYCDLIGPACMCTWVHSTASSRNARATCYIDWRWLSLHSHCSSFLPSISVRTVRPFVCLSLSVCLSACIYNDKVRSTSAACYQQFLMTSTTRYDDVIAQTPPTDHIIYTHTHTHTDLRDTMCMVKHEFNNFCVDTSQNIMVTIDLAQWLEFWGNAWREPKGRCVPRAD